MADPPTLSDIIDKVKTALPELVAFLDDNGALHKDGGAVLQTARTAFLNAIMATAAQLAAARLEVAIKVALVLPEATGNSICADVKNAEEEAIKIIPALVAIMVIGSATLDPRMLPVTVPVLALLVGGKWTDPTGNPPPPSEHPRDILLDLASLAGPDIAAGFADFKTGLGRFIHENSELITNLNWVWTHIFDAATSGVKRVTDAVDATGKKVCPGPITLTRPTLAEATIDLDREYLQTAPGDWLLLTRPDANKAAIYQTSDIAEVTRNNFFLTSRLTRVTLKGEMDKLQSDFAQAVRTTTVFTQSEALELAETPITDPVMGSEIVLDSLIQVPESTHLFIIQGKRARAQVAIDASDLRYTRSDGALIRTLIPGEAFDVLAIDSSNWQLLDAKGVMGYVAATSSQLVFIAATEQAPLVAEECVLQSTSVSAGNRTKLILNAALKNIYDRPSVTIFGNVVKATHGEMIKDETLGSGEGTQASQTFTLKKSPVTYTPDATASRGAKTSLQVAVDGVYWTEAANFFGSEASDRIYVTSIDDDDKLHIQFGDGVRGARLPTGVNNIHAKYRKGWGTAGSVAASKLTTLLDAKPGLKSATNPAPSFGWAEPETLAEARQNAPTTVLTFDRAVSLLDFENLARTYPGVGKARAAWVWDNEEQIVQLTCAASDGASIVPIQSGLLAYLDARRDPNRQLNIADFTPVGIKLHVYIVVDPNYDSSTVLANAQAAVGSAQLPDESYGFFAFERLNLDEDIHLSEVYAALQNATGVVAVEIDELHRKDDSSVTLQNIVPIGPAELAMIESAADVLIELKSEL